MFGFSTCTNSTSGYITIDVQSRFGGYVLSRILPGRGAEVMQTRSLDLVTLDRRQQCLPGIRAFSTSPLDSRQVTAADEAALGAQIIRLAPGSRLNKVYIDLLRQVKTEVSIRRPVGVLPAAGEARTHASVLPIEIIDHTRDGECRYLHNGADIYTWLRDYCGAHPGVAAALGEIDMQEKVDGVTSAVFAELMDGKDPMGEYTVLVDSHATVRKVAIHVHADHLNLEVQNFATYKQTFNGSEAGIRQRLDSGLTWRISQIGAELLTVTVAPEQLEACKRCYDLLERMDARIYALSAENPQSKPVLLCVKEIITGIVTTLETTSDYEDNPSLLQNDLMRMQAQLRAAYPLLVSDADRGSLEDLFRELVNFIAERCGLEYRAKPEDVLLAENAGDMLSDLMGQCQQERCAVDMSGR